MAATFYALFEIIFNAYTATHNHEFIMLKG